MSKLRPSREALMEVFQTPRPNPLAISKWKAGWKHRGGRVQVDNYTVGMKLLSKMTDIDPLFYQFAMDEIATPGQKAGTYIVFFKPEHEVFFKMHQDLG